MKAIKKTSLVIIDTFNYGAAITAIKKSMAQCKFDKVLFLTDIDIKVDGVKIVLIRKITSKQDYSFFCNERVV